MDMTISVIEEPSCCSTEALEESEKRWESQKIPAFPLPLGVTSPKYPHRQASIGLKMAAEKGFPESTAPPLPTRCPFSGKTTALQCCLDGDGAQLRRRQAGQTTVETADGSSCCAYDYNIIHGAYSSSLGVDLARIAGAHPSY